MKKSAIAAVLAVLIVFLLPFGVLAAQPADYPDNSDSLFFIDNITATVSAFRSALNTPPADAKAAAEALAADAVYTVYTLADGRESVGISFRCDTPEAAALLNSAVLQEFGKILEREQKSYGSGSTVFMDKTHIIGEGRLHIWGYWFTRLLGGASGVFPSYYEDFRVADLNIDENRLPSIFMLAFGLF
ncbi:MAG: hypothetical protein LBT21_00450 [Oscillospiraceae bacterium]|jgi:hypothetical protein|nr:hypothetical protein [Oscillospiraceae bacterium]